MVHPNTIRNWRKAFEDKLRSERLRARPSWNPSHDGVRHLVRLIREEFPEPEVGTRKIAGYILRAGIGTSQTSIRRVLQAEPPKPAMSILKRE